MSTISWYAIRTIPTHKIEFQVLYELNAHLGWDEPRAIVPFEIKWSKPRGSKYLRPKKFPVFPCYVFASFRHEGEFYAARKFINELAEKKGKKPPVVSLVGYGARPAVLKATDVSLLRSLSMPEPTTVAIHKALQPGGQATIIAGPFTGQTVKIDSVTRKKCKVLLRMLDSYHAVEINPASLVAA